MANFYLNGFLHWLKEVKKEKYALLYCDDLIVLGNNKEHLHQLRKNIQEYLLINLKLELPKYQVFPVTKGIDYLGYVSYPTHIKLRKSLKKSWLFMLKAYPNYKSKASFNGWLCHCNSINLQNKYYGQKTSIKRIKGVKR